MSLKTVLLGGAALALAVGLVASVVAQPRAPAPTAAAPVAATAVPAYGPADWKKLDPENLMIIDTSKGRVIVELRPELAPEHVVQLKALTRQGFYDGLKFFRVIDQFMAQTGDKANTGAGSSNVPTLKGTFSFRRGPETPWAGLANPKGGTFGFVGGEAVNSQPDDLMGLTADGKVKAYGLFCAGTAGMARTDQLDSASSQFFLMRQTFPSLDDKYTPWGRIVVGLDVVRALTVGEPPANPDVMTKVRIASDLPAAERPNVWRIDTTRPAFRAHMAAAVAAKGDAFSPCDVDVPSEERK